MPAQKKNNIKDKFSFFFFRKKYVKELFVPFTATKENEGEKKT